jgi:DNA-directed RNA polymerase specialized sigma24 family protein
LAAVMSRRRSFRVELRGCLQEVRSQEFESGLVVQISDVSPEINETALPSAEAPGKAAQSALTAGPFAHEQATIHAVADALQSRGSAPAGDLADQFRADRLVIMNKPSALRDRDIAVIWPCLTRRISLKFLVLSSASPNERTVRPGAFVTTRWSLILSGTDAKDKEQETSAALAELCRIYWRPIFAFICRRGHSTQDAEDLTQDFFVMILKGDWLRNADPSRGRFRSLLLKSLKNFLNDAVDKIHARKRGGDVSFISWDDWIAEAPSQLSMSTQTLHSLPPERLFDVRWAATVVERALRRLREECERKGRRRVFDVLSAYLTVERDDVSSAILSTTLAVPQSTVKKLLYHMRQRYRRLLRDEVAQTVENPADIEDELRHLCGVLAASSEQADK